MSSAMDDETLHWEKQLFFALSKKRKRGPEISEQRRCEDIQECLDEDVDIDTVDENGDTVLHKAVEKGYFEVVKFLRRKKAKMEILNKQGLSATMLAEQLGRTAIYKFLKESCGADVDQARPGPSSDPVDYRGPSTSANNMFHNRTDIFVPDVRNLKRIAITDNNGDNGAKKPSLASKVPDGGRISSQASVPVEEKYVQGGLTNSFHGNMYQLKHYMLILQRASKLGYSFRLAKEMEAADKLDDLVFEYRDENSAIAPIHRFVQFKHKAEESARRGKIGAGDLLNADEGNYSLLKYFLSYRRINGRPEFSGSKFKDYILCTNTDLDVDGLKEKMIDVEPVRDRDDFLRVTTSLGNKEPRCCRIKVNENHDLYDILRRASDIHRLAEVLVEHVREPKKLTLTSDILKQYHVALANEVVDIRLKRFKDNFVDPSNCYRLTAKAKSFRDVLLLHLKELPANKSKADNDIWKQLGNFKFNLSETFGKGGVTDLPDQCVSNKEISDFFKEFIIAVDQPNEIQLTGIISAEMATQFNLLNSDFTVDYFQTAVINWFKEAGTHGRYLTDIHAEELFEGIRERLSILKASGVSSRYRAELENYDINFNRENTELIEFLENSDYAPSRLSLTARNDSLLLALSVHQTLKRTTKYQKEDGCIFVKLEDFLLPDLSDYVIRAFKSSTSHYLLIIDCAERIGDLLEHDAWNALHSITTNNGSKKLIVMSQRRTDPTASDFDIRFKDLDNDSRTKVLERPLIFQGQTDLDWGTLLGISDFHNVGEEDLEDLTEIIDTDTLVKLIRSKPIEIGEQVGGRDENVDDYYIDRIIVRQGFIDKRVFEAPEVTHLFAMTGEFSQKLFVLSKLFQELRLAEPRVRRCIWLDYGREVDAFRTLCEENPDRNVHWLHGESGILTCRQSTGAISDLVRFDHDAINDGNQNKIPIAVWFKEDELLGHCDERGIVAVSDTAGMGKSTLLTRMAQRMKKKEPSLLVIRIELSSPENTRALDEEEEEPTFDVEDVESAVDFLVDKLIRPGAGTRVFKRLISKLEGRASLLFDGFDEISPKYAATVADLLEALSKLKIKNLVVTTRPHTRSMIESRLDIGSHTLLPFTEENQKTFLIKFWEQELSLAGIDERVEKLLEDHAQTVIHLLSNSINDRLREFTGIPLQTRMVAEVYSIVNKKDPSSLVIPSLPERIDMIDLYCKFVEKKYDIYFEEKNHGVRSNQGQKSVDSLGRKISDAAHQKLALETLFEKEDVEALLLTQRNVEGFFDLWQEEHKGGERTGIVTQVVDGKPRFVHRTFAEYFAAVFLFSTLRDESRNKSLREFFLAKFFLAPEHETTRAFVNCLLLGDSNAFNQDPWTFDLREYRSKVNDTVYHVAAKERNTGIIRFFLDCMISNSKHQAVPKSVTSHDQTEGCMKTCSEDLDEAKPAQKLQSEEDDPSKIDIDIQGDRLTTPLHVALLSNADMELIKCIVNAGADVNAYDNHRGTPLREATESNNLEAVKFLIHKGATIDVQDGYGSTALHYASAPEKLDIAKYLVDQGAKIDIKNMFGLTPLYLALHHGSADFAKYLIDRGADINTRDRDDSTLLHAASHGGSIEIAEFLINAGAEVDARDHINHTPLLVATEPEKFELAKFLIDKGANIHAANNHGWTPLLSACYRSNTKLAEFLLDLGSHIRTKNKDGETPLHQASAHGNVELVKLLIDRGADVHDQERYGKTPLHFAARRDVVPIVKLLVDNGASIHAEDDSGKTPLYIAIDLDSRKVCKFFIGLGARIPIVWKPPPVDLSLLFNR